MEKLNNSRPSENLRNLSSPDKISSVEIQSNQSQVAHSGNSDVNVHVNIQVDVTPIAFAVLYSLLATKQLSNEEFELALKKLEKFKS
ncbi:hypothetical protein [Bacillus methanolicus]|uniref:hypothetical protein n=1 Tax=Bacillus methanolicus TaxID=1471 RepID=UPI0023805DE6|nr:hypothetical protein [Bacillus methanolicus]